MKTLLLKTPRTESNVLKIGEPHNLRLVEGTNTVDDSVNVEAVQKIAKDHGFSVKEVIPEPEPVIEEQQDDGVDLTRPTVVAQPAVNMTVLEDRPVKRRSRDESQPLDIPAEG